MKIMGIESSCDETGVGIVELSEDGHMEILANAVASSMEQHARFGGVVPEIASRAHLEAMPQVMQAALNEAGIAKPDAIAATVGPGLAGALLVGASAAKAYAAAWGVPFYGVNHLGGHVAVANLEGEELPHSVALLVSGGHTQLLEVEAVGKPMRELGSTLDDAAGEAYDKVSRLLGLGYPGGKVLDELAQQGDSSAVPFPRGMTGPRDARHSFSFSGLKTAVRRAVVLEVEQSTAQAEAEVADALAAARAANGPALAAAEEAARIARIGYAEGKFPQLELIEAERSLAETRESSVDALAALHTARARLARLQGSNSPIYKD